MKPSRKDELIPSPLEALFYAVISVVIIAVSSVRFLTDYLTQDTPGAREGLKAQTGEYVNSLLRFVDGLAFTPTTAVFLFWSIAGIVTFSLLQAAYNVYVEAKTDVDITTRFLHPRRFVKTDFWLEVLLQALAHFSLMVMAITALLIVGFILAPLSVTSMRLLFDGFSAARLAGFLAACLFLYLGVAITAAVVKFLLKRKQLKLPNS